MKNNRFRIHGSLGEPCLAQARNWVRTALGIGALVVGLGTVTAPVRVGAIPAITCLSASASNLTVWTWDVNGYPVLVQSASVRDGNVYDDGILLGVIDGSGNVLDANGNIVAYVACPDPGL